jgi:2-polyprenyl-3-methyl-5-hydroxy-6-metoxy-1,4-benzoquinol methylase
MTTPSWSPSPQYRKVAEANRQYYARNACLYEATETCVTDPAAQHYLEYTLDSIVEQMGRPACESVALDACGGTGNVALKLLRRGLKTTITDISRDQLAIFESKCVSSGFTADVFCTEVADFLTQRQRAFDLIVFSSALHHLENVQAVLHLCLTALKPGGLLFTIHDPTSRDGRKRLTRAVLRADYFAFKCLEQFLDLPAAMGRRIKRIFLRADSTNREDVQITDATLGVLAEYYANSGIDDLKLVADLQSFGFQVIWHKRRSGGRYGITRRLVSRLGDKTEFELLLRRPDTEKP